MSSTIQELPVGQSLSTNLIVTNDRESILDSESKDKESVELIGDDTILQSLAETKTDNVAKPSYHEAILRAKKVITSIISSLQELHGNEADDVDLTDIGLDSLTATELANQLSDEFNINIIPSMIIDNPTVKALVQLIVGQVDVLQDIVKASAASGGNLYENNPWFANYFAENAR